MWKSIAHGARHLLRRDPHGWHPLLAVYYLTYACELRCPYCADGLGRPYHTLKNPVLRGLQLHALLEKIRAACDHLVITGGEPLRHPEFGAFLDRLPGYRFDSAILTTSGHGLLPFADGVARAFSHVVFSLDTLDTRKGDGYYGRGPGVHDEIVATIRAMKASFPRRPRLLLSCVATPDNLDDVPAVYDFARRHGLRFSLSPVLRGVAPDAALIGNPKYHALFDRLLADQRRGADIHGSPAYLRGLRDFSPFRCRPSTVMALSPSGQVFYPCLEQGQTAGSLLDAPDAHALRAQAMRDFGPEPRCPNQCHSPCALGFSLLFERPSTVFEEALTYLRSLPFRMWPSKARALSSVDSPPRS